MTRKQAETRWVVVKDYYKDNTNYTDQWPFLYGKQEEAEEAKRRLEDGQDKSFYDAEGNEYAGYEAFLYVDQITL